MNNASEDAATTMTNVPMDNVPSDAIDIPIKVDDDHKQPDEGQVPKPPDEGNAQHMMRKLPRKHLKLSRLNFKLERPRTRWQNQLAKNPE